MWSSVGGPASVSNLLCWPEVWGYCYYIKLKGITGTTFCKNKKLSCFDWNKMYLIVKINIYFGSIDI